MLDNTVIPTSYLARRRRNVSEIVREEIGLLSPTTADFAEQVSEFITLTRNTY